MSDAPVASPASLLAMTAVTGVVDAVSFLMMGHVFTANMMGNIALLRFALAGTAGLAVSRSSVGLIAFLAGTVGGGRMTLDVSGDRWVSRGFLMEVIRSISLPLAVCSVITAGCAIAHMHINSNRRQL